MSHVNTAQPAWGSRVQQEEVPLGDLRMSSPASAEVSTVAAGLTTAHDSAS